MAQSFHSVTLHQLSAGAKAAGVGYPEIQLVAVTPPEILELLTAFHGVAAGLSIYEPSNPEIRIKGERGTYVVRTRYRRLSLVGHESAQRGEDPSPAEILAEITGTAAPVPAAPRLIEPTLTASPLMTRPSVSRAASASRTTRRSHEWVKVVLLLMLSAGCLGSGAWLLLKPPTPPGPKFTRLPAAESRSVLERAAGEFRTGTAEGDRRLLLSADGTLRLAKFGPAQSIAEEIIRTVNGASLNGQTALATTDPYLLIVTGRDTIQLFGQTFTRVVP